jgi:hypothetical protein
VLNACTPQHRTVHAFACAQHIAHDGDGQHD